MKMVGYGRVSTDQEKQLDSLKHQIEFFSDFAKSHGHELLKVYSDEGISGKQLKRRDEFNRMMEDAERKNFDVVVVKDVSRFSRNTVDLLTSVRKLKFLGIDVIFVNNSQKILGESEFVITLLGAIAQEESSNLSKRVKFGKNINAKKGRVPPRIFGYDRIDNYTLQINEEEARAIRKIYDLYIDEGLGCRLICQEMERLGMRMKYGGQWNSTAVRRIIENPIYCGRYLNHKYEVANFLEGDVQPLPREQYYEHDRPQWAIVSPERFAEAQGILASRRKQYRTDYTETMGRYSNRHLFSTLIRCKECGRAFTRKMIHNKYGDYVFWRCPTNNEYAAKRCKNNTIINEKELIENVSAYLESIVGNRDAFAKEILEKYKASAADGNTEPETSIDDLTRQKTRLEKKSKKFQEMYVNDVISIDDLKKAIGDIDRDIQSINQSLSNKDAASEKMKKAESNIQAALEEIDNFLSLKSASNMDMRKIISRILVDQNHEIQIHLVIDKTIGTQ